LKDSEEKVTGAIETLQDITDRKTGRGGADPRASLFAACDRHGTGFICVKREDGRYALVNKALADAYGTTVADSGRQDGHRLQGTTPGIGRFPGDDLDVIRRRETKTIPEEQITYADGTIHWLSTTKIPLVMPDRTCSQLLAVAYRHHGAQAGRGSPAESEKRLRAFTLAIPDVALVVDEDGRYVDNADFC